MATKVIKTKSEARRHYDLYGFTEIEEFIKPPPAVGSINFIRWRNLWDFPVRSIENQWFSSKAEIEKWAKDQGFASCNYQDFDFAKLEKERLLKMRETGEIRKFDFMIHDANLIAEFCGRSLPTVMDWGRDRDDCPIIKNENGWEVDANELQLWLEKWGFVGFRAPGHGVDCNKFLQAERRWQEARK